jgi:acyl-CoA thioesterase I
MATRGNGTSHNAYLKSFGTVGFVIFTTDFRRYDGMSQDLRICFVGDSFVNGVGDRTYLGWTGRLCQNLADQGSAVTYYNLGVRRDTSVDIGKRWEAETTNRLPQGCDNRIVFSFGTNDATWENGQQRVCRIDSFRHCRRILSMAKNKYPILMISPPPIADPQQNTRTEKLCEDFWIQCQELNIPFLDIFTPLSQSRTYQEAIKMGDGAHPGAEGYVEMAHLIQSWSVWKSWFSTL